MQTPKAYIETYGCTFNQADSQIMKGILCNNGISLSPAPEDADILILNTCSVKLSTEQKITYRIQELSKLFPNKKLVIAGCMVETNQKELEKAAPNASWVGPLQTGRIKDACRSALNGKTRRFFGRSDIVKANATKIRDNPAIAIVPICEGCIGACSFCSTRFARGPLFSYPADCILKDIRNAVEKGAKEIQITAQDTGAYGKDTGENLPALLGRISQLNGRFLIRLGMINPRYAHEMKNELIDCFKSKKIYKFLHIPVQSGNDGVLKNMRRPYSVEQFKDTVSAFRSSFPDMTIATDIIVGFPGESESAFEDTMTLIKEIKPDVVNVSRFTPRPRTDAKKMEQLASQVIKERSKRMSELCRSIAREKNAQLIGKTREILITERQKTLTGRNANYKQVALVKGNAAIGEFVRVRITGVGGGCLLAAADLGGTDAPGEKNHLAPPENGVTTKV